MLPEIPAMPPELVQRGSDPTLLGAELIHNIREAITWHPRSNQRIIGPSEIGTPCLRRLGLRLSGAPTRPRPAWRPTIGTAVHAWLAEQFLSANGGMTHPRFLVETRVEVGSVDGQVIQGTADLYDRTTCTVVDWKIVGPTTLKRVKAHGSSMQYRYQTQLYGRGFVNRGAPVDVVAVMYLPLSGDLSEAVYRPESYDPSMAEKVLDTADAIAQGIRAVGAEYMIQELPRTENYCTSCDFYRYRAADLVHECPGAPDAIAAQQESTDRQMRGLIA